MSYTREEYLQSKIDVKKRKTRRAGYATIIIGIISFIAIPVWASTKYMLDTTLLITGISIPIWFLPMLIIILALRRRTNKAKDNLYRFRVEQSEKLEIKGEVPGRYDRVISKESKVEEKVSKTEDILVFVSYATVDADQFKIKESAQYLAGRKEIKEVLFWQKDMKDDIYGYMDQNLGKCDVMLLFCSPTALDSVPVKKEWTAADSMKIPIIPVFISPKYIPPLLRSRLGIEFDPFNLQQSYDEIHKLILKKLS